MVIEVLFPHACNLYGDRGNVIYLQKNLPNATFIETGLNDRPYFADHDVDLIYLGPSSESAQEKFVERLSVYRDRLNELINNGTFFLLTGNAPEVFGSEVVDSSNTGFKGLGLIDLHATRSMFNRKNSLYMGCYGDVKVVGFQTQFTVMESSEEPLFKTEFGLGRNENSRCEGIRKNNLLATYLVGPILVLNPLFTKKLFKEMNVEIDQLYLEKEAMEAFDLRVEDFYRAQKIQHIK